MNTQKILQKKSAILVIDAQNDYLHEDGIMSKIGLGVANSRDVIARLGVFLQAARKKGIPVFHTQMTEAEHLIAPNLRAKRIEVFGEAKNWELAIPGTWGHDFVITVPQDEKVFEKNTHDAFANEALDRELKALGVETLIIIGGYTHACVESTVRGAVTKGYNVVMVLDLVVAPEKLAAAHEGSLKTVLSLFALGVKSAEVMSHA